VLHPLSSTAGEQTLAGHWKRPVIAGGGHFSLNPTNCASCHAAQYEGWKDSLHAKAVGPGLSGQLDLKANAEMALSCYACHAPLSEQEEVREKSGGKFSPNRKFDASLQKSGVSCAACHVRNGKVYGPPPSGELKTNNTGTPMHPASESREFFQRSEFCVACHQLDEGYKVNGKILVNTYGEWKKSGWATDGVQCQNCHMPDRAHLFKGIHDKEMTFRALDIAVSSGKGAAKLVVSNVGAGHYFPTYVTPIVEIRAYQMDANGKAVAGSKKLDYIGRKVSLDLETEEFDTRIPPGGSHEFVYKGAGRVVFEIWVYPDQFYNGLFKLLLDNDQAANPQLIRKAHENSAASPYLLWKGESRINDGR
jgi:hypothetical protein